MLLSIVFIVMSVAVLGFAVLTVTARKMFDAALFLVGALFGVAVLYVLLEAEFLAVVQVMVYVGAIATLIVFAIMLSRNMMRRDIRGANEQWAAGLVAALLLFVILAVVITGTGWQTATVQPAPDMIGGIGQALVGDYVVPFEVASVLLLAGMVGAIIIARERE
jgi:NADH:ubiquinone oxidoreductase subunit 6 (subunit J)